MILCLCIIQCKEIYLFQYVLFLSFCFDSLNDMINNGNTNEKTSSIESAVEIGDDSDISFASIE